MDKNSNIFELKNKIFLKGNFKGKYLANRVAALPSGNLSNISILEGRLDHVEKCELNSLFNIKSDTLHHQNAFNVEINLDDDLLKDKYVFIEEFNNSTLYDITLSDHQIEDNDTFGVIEAKMICRLEDTCEFKLHNENTYTISKEIDFDDSTLPPIKRITNFFNSWTKPFKRFFIWLKRKLFFNGN